ncbi:MAG: MotA/TolQ/ExbB proton channel family protein [Deltaproteobacteria bacterium]|nr:MotA/TolQ/ExbB proton channel family protein [Deltaproteobacteria bacterium]
MFENLSFIELLQKGGISVVVLGLLSVISIAIMLERAWSFSKFRKGMRDFFPALDSVIKQSGVESAAKVCLSNQSALAAVFLAGHRKAGKGKAEVSDAMELSARSELARLDRLLGVLGTIGSTAPFIGLFGTVLGIIRAFSDLAISQGASPAAVADGIAEALVATAAGLFVAIPAVMAYNYFIRSASRHALELETLASEFTEALGKGNSGGLEDKR